MHVFDCIDDWKMETNAFESLIILYNIISTTILYKGKKNMLRCCKTKALKLASVNLLG